MEFIRKARQFDAKADVANGQALLWGKADEGSLQGVTELTECVRTEDPWLLEIQLEMRAGNLSTEAWHFLHGQPTEHPGSWLNGKLSCENRNCVHTWAQNQQECETCQAERKRRHRVLNKPNDMRHLEEKFVTAPAIFANNDIKFDVNKSRAQIFAETTEQAITWSIARDKPSNKVIATKPNLAEEKKVWLTRGASVTQVPCKGLASLRRGQANEVCN